MNPTRRPATRRARSAVAALACLIAALVPPAACSQGTRYRVLSFFFDGVPETGVRLARQDPSTSTTGAGDVSESQVPPVRRMIAHQPYKEGKCDACHDRASGGLYKTEQQGLCLDCHAAIVKGSLFRHGPVAAGACTACHHHHASPEPKLLLESAATICFRCHMRNDLTETAGHDSTDTPSCLACHDPHGGTDRFFLTNDGR